MVDNDWLNSLVVGDKVAVTNHCHATKTKYHIGTITKITKTRQIEIDGKDPKFKNGRARYSEWSFAYIYPLTEERKAEIMRDNLISKLNRVDWEKVNTDKLNEIKKILNI